MPVLSIVLSTYCILILYSFHVGRRVPLLLCFTYLVVHCNEMWRMFILVTLDRECSAFDIHMSVRRNIIPNHSQQVATFLEFIYFYRRFICFRRFLRPSLGEHNCTYSFRYCHPVLLLYAIVVPASSSIG
jgi:hypothetical protein